MNDVIEYIKKAAIELPSIRRVLLYGSRARGDFNSKSDYDIAVFGCNENDRYSFINALDDIPTLYKIDLAFIRESHKGTKFYDNIIKDGVVIVDKFLHKLENYRKAVARLDEIIKSSEKENWDGILDAVIKRFEFTEELAWKTTREYLLSEGYSDVNSPKSAMKAAFQMNLITDEKNWALLLEDRNNSAHVYDEEKAQVICDKIKKTYINLFKELLEKLEEKGDSRK